MIVRTDLKRVWDDLFTDEDRRIGQAGGYFASVGMGERPVIIVIDVTRDFTGDKGDDHPTSVRKFRLSCGPAAWTAIPYIQRLLALGRERDVPIVYARPLKALQRTSGGPRSKNSRAMNDTEESRSRGNEFPTEIAPRQGDLVIEKPRASAFFQTPLLAYLGKIGADHLIVAGISTSGCVRATVFDGVAYDFSITVVEECVFDRFPTSHKVNLFDMNSKLADVIPLDELAVQLRNVTAWGAVEPAGAR